MNTRPPTSIDVRDTLTAAQAAVLDFIDQHPGSRIQDVAKSFRVGHSTASYHLWNLTKSGTVRRERDGREVRHYAGIIDATAILRALLADPKRARLIRMLATWELDRMTMNQVAKKAGCTFNFARRTLFQLQQGGLLGLERRGFRYQIRDAAKFRGALVQISPAENVSPPFHEMLS